MNEIQERCVRVMAIEMVMAMEIRWLPLQHQAAHPVLRVVMVWRMGSAQCLSTSCSRLRVSARMRLRVLGRMLRMRRAT
jgi:hypothetical protein